MRSGGYAEFIAQPATVARLARAGFVDELDQVPGIFHRRLLQNAVTQIENVARAVVGRF